MSTNKNISHQLEIIAELDIVEENSGSYVVESTHSNAMQLNHPLIFQNVENSDSTSTKSFNSMEMKNTDVQETSVNSSGIHSDNAVDYSNLMNEENNNVTKHPLEQARVLKNISNTSPSKTIEQLFAHHVFWPEIKKPSGTIKSKPKVRMPAVLSSKEGVEYFEKQREKKENIEAEKILKRKQREDAATLRKEMENSKRIAIEQKKVMQKAKKQETEQQKLTKKAATKRRKKTQKNQKSEEKNE
ncbi:hypothetical protein TKK_0013575 [Trichogramma kaykai]